jgi:L-galactose dehydrogenase
MEYRVLGSTGLRVSKLGFGASPLGDVFQIADPGECTRAVDRAIDLGINYFDVAPYYGDRLAETRLGAALEGKRTQVVLATKVGRYGNYFDFSASRVYTSIDESLSRLRTDYIDLWQANDIEFGDARQVIEETLPAMREVRRQGKVRYIGITGYQLKMLRRVAETAGVDAVLSYCRYNPLATDLDRLMTPFATEQRIGLINASPLHMGILTVDGPPAWHPASAAVKQAGAAAADLCRTRGVDIADLALQFALAHPYTATTLVGMSMEGHVERNVEASQKAPDPVLLKEVLQLIAPVADMTWPCGKAENEDYAQVAAH